MDRFSPSHFFLSSHFKILFHLHRVTDPNSGPDGSWAPGGTDRPPHFSFEDDLFSDLFSETANEMRKTREKRKSAVPEIGRESWLGVLILYGIIVYLYMVILQVIYFWCSQLFSDWPRPENLRVAPSKRPAIYSASSVQPLVIIVIAACASCVQCTANEDRPHCHASWPRMLCTQYAVLTALYSYQYILCTLRVYRVFVHCTLYETETWKWEKARLRTPPDRNAVRVNFTFQISGGGSCDIGLELAQNLTEKGNISQSAICYEVSVKLF